MQSIVRGVGGWEQRDTKVNEAHHLLPKEHAVFRGRQTQGALITQRQEGEQG